MIGEFAAHPGVVFWIRKKHFGQLIKDIDQLCTKMLAEGFRGGIFYL